MTEQQPTLMPEKGLQRAFRITAEKVRSAVAETNFNAERLGLAVIALLTLSLQSDLPQHLPRVPDFGDSNRSGFQTNHHMLMEGSELLRPDDWFRVENSNNFTSASDLTSEEMLAPSDARKPPIYLETATSILPEQDPVAVDVDVSPYDRDTLFTSLGITFESGSPITITLSADTAKAAGLSGEPSFSFVTQTISTQEEFPEVYATALDYRKHPNQMTALAGVKGGVALFGHAYYLDGNPLPLDWSRQYANNTELPEVGDFAYYGGLDAQGNEVQMPARITFVGIVDRETMSTIYRNPKEIDPDRLLVDTEVFAPGDTSDLYTVTCDKILPDGTFGQSVVIGYTFMPDSSPQQGSFK